MAGTKLGHRKTFYTMGEVSEMFDLPATTIRFWENSFRDLKPKRNAKGNRLFTNEDIETLRLIVSLVKERGMTIKGAADALKAKRAALKRNATTVELLNKIKKEFEQLLSEIDESQEEKENTIKVDMEQPNEYELGFTQLTLFDDEEQ